MAQRCVWLMAYKIQLKELRVKLILFAIWMQNFYCS